MEAQREDDLRRALLRLFSSLLDTAEKDISPSENLRDRFSAARWVSLDVLINRLPEVKARGLSVGPGDMARLSTIAEIEAALHDSEGKPPAERPSSGIVFKRYLGDTFKLDKFSVDEGFSLPEAAPPGMDGAAPDAAPAADAAQPPDQAEYKVWYVTSRKPNDPADSSKGYSAERDTKIHYGTCTVFIPESHKIGSLGSSWWKRLITLTDDRLKLLSTDETNEPSFWASLASTLAAVDFDERDALIFVHGYNVSFADAALRAAQIGFDLSIKGAMAFFSWPSRGTLKGYPADEATIEANEHMIAEFMTKFAAQSNARAVHIIAHSMGNRGVLRAVDRIAQQAERASGVPFGQIILAAADVDAGTFRNLCAAYPKLSKRTTLYVSQRDLAVESSEWLHDFARVGLMPPIFIAPGIDTINVTNADLTALGHGYVASARDVLQDMHDLIVHGAPPGKRFGLRAMATEDGSPYWLIGQ